MWELVLMSPGGFLQQSGVGGGGRACVRACVASKFTYRLQHSELHLPKLVFLHPRFPHNFGTPFPGFLRERSSWESGEGWSLPDTKHTAPAVGLTQLPSAGAFVTISHAHLAGRETGPGSELCLEETKYVSAELCEAALSPVLSFPY